MKATEINTNNINQIESGEINGYEVFIHKFLDDLWTLQIVGPGPKFESLELDCESFNEALENYNIEVNYLRQNAKLRPCWLDY